MDRNTRVILGLLVVGAMGAVPYLTGALYIAPPPPPAAPAYEAPTQIVEHLPIAQGDTMDEILVEAGLDPTTRIEIVQAFNEAFDIRKVRAGREFLLTRWEKTGEIASLEYIVDADHQVQLFRADGISSAELVEIPGVVREVPVCARLQDSLAATMDRAGESFVLALIGYHSRP
jgi:hypothetical protein